MMKIEAGKYYRSRDGRKFGPMVWRGYPQDWPWYANERTFTGEGRTGYYKHIDNSGDLIAEWTDTPDTPKLWRDMTPEEKGALLLAHHEGKVIEGWMYGDKWTQIKPDWSGHNAYRVKSADPVVETVTIDGRNTSIGWEWISQNPNHHTHRITFQTIDGKPDCASIRMEPLE